MKKVDFGQTIPAVDGRIMQERFIEDGEAKERDLTLRAACTFVLARDVDNDEQTVNQRLDRIILALKIRGATKPVDISIDEAKTIKDRAELLPDTWLMAMIHLMIEGTYEQAR